MVFLLGCQSDQKQTAKIQKTLVESASFEHHFTANLSDLNETRKSAQSIYVELISLDINDQNQIHQQIDKAQSYTKEQQKLLEEATENFQKAYQMVVTLEEPIQKMKDKKLKKQASKLITMMNERKNVIDSFFENYHKNIETQNTFYQQLADENYHLKNLNELIHEINNRTQSMEAIIQEFNQSTQQYIDLEKKILNH